MEYKPTWEQFSWNSWGFSSEDGPPDKEEMFSDYSSFEGFLQHNEVFQSVDGQSRHMDSYMTLVCFDALNRAIRILKETYLVDDEFLANFAEKWTENRINMQIPSKIVAGFLTKNSVETWQNIEGSKRKIEISNRSNAKVDGIFIKNSDIRIINSFLITCEIVIMKKFILAIIYLIPFVLFSNFLLIVRPNRKGKDKMKKLFLYFSKFYL